MSELTPVIFRKFRDGDIIALFPADCGDNSPRTCASFMHVGQHGAADPGIVSCTKAATPSEYAGLKRELESAPYHYTLKVYKRIQRRWYAERASQLSR